MVIDPGSSSRMQSSGFASVEPDSYEHTFRSLTPGACRTAWSTWHSTAVSNGESSAAGFPANGSTPRPVTVQVPSMSTNVLPLQLSASLVFWLQVKKRVSTIVAAPLGLPSMVTQMA